MNFHDDVYLMSKVWEHYEEAQKLINPKRIIGIFCQGSPNYGLDTKESDMDTKLIIVPSFEDLALNKAPISTTHVRANDEHIDIKDVRLMMNTFRKQNLNFLEVLFTPYFFLNPMYETEWLQMMDAGEYIAHYNPYLAVKAMAGHAYEKHAKLTHRSVAREHIVDKYGYDGKQLHHLLRIEEYLDRYINGVSFKEAMVSLQPEYLKEVKSNELYSLEEAQAVADESLSNINEMVAALDKDSWNHSDKAVEQLMEEVQKDIMRISLKEELK